MQLDKVLVPVDFSACSVKAARAAADLVRISGGQLILLHVPDVAAGIGLETPIRPTPGAEPIPLHEYLEQRTAADFAALQAELGAITSLIRLRPARKPAGEIIAEAAEQEVDLIVMGSHGRDGFQRLLMGSVTERVIRQSTTPVLVIPNTET